MSIVIPAKDRTVFWAWVAWMDAKRNAATVGKPLPPRPRIVTTYLKSHYKIPALWWARYAIHVGTPVKPPNPPVPVPPPVPLAAHVQNIIFAAQSPLTALGAPSKYGIALTADPAYAEWATPSTVAALRQAGHRVYAWGNQSQIPAMAIYSLRDRLKLDGCIFQSETENELLSGFAAGAQLFVGNPNSWVGRISTWNRRAQAGEVAMSMEVYTNATGSPWPSGASSQGAIIASECIGCYDASGEHSGVGRDIQPSQYKQHTPPAIWAGICVYHAAGVWEGWGAL